jgi:serine/threonine-protein kinase HipA
MADEGAEVVVQIGGEDVHAGRLWSHRRGASESATFAYDPAYLARPDAYQLDPALQLVAGQQQTPTGLKIFGAFSDSAPDRWGRRVIARNAEQAGGDGRGGRRSFGEIDYLLGVRDDMRQGALRFRDPTRGVFLADEKTGIPPLVDLPELLGAADRLERDEASEEQLRMLLRGGSSLGGARPKANVLLADGRVAIAKFPSADDDHDVIRWEAVALGLARAAGIEVADWRLHLADDKPVLLIDRFDRAAAKRVGYVSAMTMLEATDGTRGSYLEIAAVVEDTSPTTTGDLHQLWRRIAFSTLASNTDDHLRNHGFLRRTSAGWSLAPAFDLNPDPEPGPKHFATSIDGGDDRSSAETLMSVIDDFRLSREEAIATLGEVRTACEKWRAVAAKSGLSAAAVQRMAPAFEHEESAAAAALVNGQATIDRGFK